MAKGSRKGGAFERWFCQDLSLWFSGGESDDWFWRTAGSGGRATVRRKKGKKTRGQDGDVAATHPSGKPLIDLLHIELKCGYSGHTPYDMLDKTRNHNEQLWTGWIRKAHREAASAGRHWMIVQRRDRRKVMVVMEQRLASFIAMGRWAQIMIDGRFVGVVTWAAFKKYVTEDTLGHWDRMPRPKIKKLVFKRTKEK